MRLRTSISAVTLCVSALITGCGFGPSANPAAFTGLALQGVVHGGRAPINGAHIYLFAAGTTAYAGNGVAASTTNASVSLLNATQTGYSDATGAYVPSGTDGSFAITGDYSCTPGQQVYLYSSGGDAGGGSANSAATLMLALGSCPGDGTFAGHVPFLVINEVTTIAAAYALAGWATDPLHISTDSAASGNTTASNATTGIALAFKNAAMLAGPWNGLANATVGTNGTVPQQEINTLANILAACVNTTGPGSTACSTLLGAAKSGGTTGSSATDTADAAINIAHYPAAAVTSLFNLQTATSPYANDLGSAPTDFTMGIYWLSSGIGSQWVYVDSQGNAWFTASQNLTDTVFEVNPAGSANAFKTGLNLNHPTGAAIQNGTDNIWIANYYNQDIAVLNSSGGLVATYGATQTTPDGSNLAPGYLAFDASGNAWLQSPGNHYITKMAPNGTSNSSTALSLGYNAGSRGLVFDTSGILWDVTGNAARINTATSTVTSYNQSNNNVYDVYAVASDALGNTWFSQYYGGIQRFQTSGTLIAPSGGFTNGPFAGQTSWGFSFDGANHGWFPTFGGGQNSVLVCVDGATPNAATSLTILGPATGYATNNVLQGALSSAVDNAGDVWIANANDLATEFIGLGVPVVTPVSQAVATGKVATRP